MTAVDALHDVSLVASAEGLLAAFNAAGVLAPADVHVATTLGRLGGEDDETVLLAVALAVRAPRTGHVCVDLATARDTVTVIDDDTTDPASLPWPETETWLARVAASPLVGGDDEDGARPLRRDGTRLYLDRYHRYERRVAADLLARATAPPPDVDTVLLRDGLDRLFPPVGDDAGPDLQRLAAATAVLRRFAVVAGGPGTGKTTTVAKVLALLIEQAAAAGVRPPRVALAAPTGKAAARLEEAIRDGAPQLATGEEVRRELAQATASTLHRLLRGQPGSQSRFRHHADNPLPHDVVVVDETSMVSLALMAKLLDALRPDARLVLLGDPQQLASVEAGAVLGDVAGPATEGLRLSEPIRRLLGDVTGQPVPASAGPGGPLADSVIVLRRVHRFGGDSGIAALAAAIERGDAAGALDVLASGAPDVRWIPRAPHPDEPTLRPLRDAVVATGQAAARAAREGDGAAALAAVDRLRLLCAHRRGPYGVATWVPAVERWLAGPAGSARVGSWYVGRPVLVTANDYQLGVFNGDVGVTIVGDDGELVVALRGDEGQIRTVSPTQLYAVETVHAMTVHKSQGSQFREVAVLLPEPTSRLLTRELLYTAVTRAQERLTVVGDPDAVTTAVTHRIERASGLRDALWGAAGR